MNTLDDINKRKHNMKLYPTYLMLGFDLLFYYGIRVMFLTEVKGISSSQILLSITIYGLSMIIMQIPTTLLATKIGYKNSCIVGNIINIIWAISIIAFKSFTGLVITQILSGIAFAIKFVAEPNLLTTSIPNEKGYERNAIFTMLDKKGYSRYCILSAISTIVSGFLYKLNPYIPIILCLICIIISTVISFNFTDIKEDNSKMSYKEYIKELRKGYKFVTKSKRLRALLLMTGSIWGILALLDTYQLTLLQSIGAGSIEIGLIFATLELTKGLFSNRANEFNKRFKNRSLTNLLLTFAIGFIIAGGIALLKLPFYAILITIIITILILGGANAIYQILAKRYVNNFASTKILPAIYSSKSICDNIARMIMTFGGGAILGIFNIQISMIIVGILIFVITLLLTIYSNNKLGLHPDKYTAKDIYKR